MTERITDNIEVTKQAEQSLVKNVLISAGIGGGAGGLFSIIYGLIADTQFYFELIHIVGFILLSSTVSGIVGLGGHLLDDFLMKKGVTSSVVRSVITLVLAALFIGTVMVFLASHIDFVQFQPESFLALAGVAGFVVAIATMFFEHSVLKMKRKMLILEIENKYLEEIANKEKELEEATKNLIVTRERNRMARELHDSISQGLHGINYTTYSLRKRIEDNADPSQWKTLLDHLEQTTEETVKELRKMIFELKPSNLEEKGLCKSLLMQCQLFEHRFGIKVRYDIDDVKRMTPEQELAVYRVTQEALTNIQKHSEASEVRVLFKETAGKVFLTIGDNGKGIKESNGEGYGLDNMRTRVFQNNGRFDIESKEGEGTVIKAVFDIMEE